MFALLTVLFIVVSVTLVLIILVQRPQGGGLAGAFGGAGGSGADTVFGGRVGDALTWATSIIFVLFLLIAIGLNWSGNAKLRPATDNAAVTSPEGADETGGGGGDTTGGTDNTGSESSSSSGGGDNE